MAKKGHILVVNGGSSSIKVALYSHDKHELHLSQWSIKKIAMPGMLFEHVDADGNTSSETLEPLPYSQAAELILSKIKQEYGDTISAIGHRVVHGGGHFAGPAHITQNVMNRLISLQDLDPEHMPGATMLIQKAHHVFEGVPQVACFDTAFYADLPRIAQIVPIPRKFESLGIRRYGFHGLSYTYLLQKFSELCGITAAQGRVIYAHLGSGVSLTATKGGRPVETTMGFTPASGVPMSTRSGDIDPGVVLALHNQAKLSVAQIHLLLNEQSGLLGVSETSADMYELLQSELSDARAAEAVELFCYQVRKSIGSLTAVLGGVDSIVFSGGMGENAPKIRKRILKGLEYLGVELDDDLNNQGTECISTGISSVGVHVIHTDESRVIVQQVADTLFTKQLTNRGE